MGNQGQRCLKPGSALLLFIVIGCAGLAPVPGGVDTVNSSFYSTRGDLLDRLSAVQQGMTKERVFFLLNRDEAEMTRLPHEEVALNLSGGRPMSLPPALEGFRFSFKTVERRHGFSSPIRLTTDEKGYDYTVTLIFNDGRLLEEPMLTGGPVSRTSSKTLFDYVISWRGL
jgi:hypothetical protein